LRLHLTGADINSLKLFFMYPKDAKGFDEKIKPIVVEFFNEYACVIKPYDVDELNEVRRRYSLSLEKLKNSELLITYISGSVKVVGLKEKVEGAVSIIDGFISQMIVGR